MAIKTFIPELWSTALLANLRSKSVVEAFVNHNYEGLITQQGDTVHINTLNDISVKKYVKGEKLSYDDLDLADQTLLIDQLDYAGVSIDDVDKVQANGDLFGPATENIAYQINKSYDKYIFNNIIAKAATAEADNMVGTDASPIDISSDNAVIDAIVDILVKANQNDIPENRVGVVTPVVSGQILKSDKRSISPLFADFVSKGYIGNLYGIEWFMSNNLEKTDAGNELILVSNPQMTTVANQFSLVEALRDKDSIADFIRALHVYGAKTLYKNGVVGAYVSTKKNS